MEKGHNLVSHSSLHYLLAIHKLCEDDKRCRAVDISNYLKLAKSSVTIAIKRLKKDNFISEDNNNNLYLNEKGHKAVHFSLASRSLVYNFLKNILKVNHKIAKEDSCKIEHLLSQDVQKKLFLYLKNISILNKNLNLELSLSDFKSYSEFIKEQVEVD